jgi:hypothetical protein
MLEQFSSAGNHGMAPASLDSTGAIGSPSDLHYIVGGTALLLSAGIGVLVASEIEMALGQTG